MSKLILVRHGQASAFTDDYDRLSELGRRQGEMLGKWWMERGLEVGLVFSGPLKRQKGTAEIVRDTFRRNGLSFPDPVIMEELEEIDADRIMAYFNEYRIEYPELERLIKAFRVSDDPEEKARIFQEYFEQAMLLWVSGKVKSPGIESLSHLRSRVVKALERIMHGAGDKGNIVVFTSATPVSIMTGALLELDDRQTMEITFRLKNCSVTEFVLKERGPVLHSFNCTGYLRPEMLTIR